MKNFDALRDQNFIGFSRHIDAGLRRHSMPEYQAACKRLMAIINQNGRKLYNYSYDKQTASMESLFNDLDNPQSREDLATANATEWLEELKADNEALKKAYIERGKTEATKDIPTDAVALKELIQAMEFFVTVINAAQINSQIEGIEKTIDLLNEAIDRSLASARQSAASKQQSDEPNESTESAES